MTTNRAPTAGTLSVALLLVAATVSLPTLSQAATGSVSLVLTKGGLIVGVSGGRGVLTFRGRHYKFKISGMSVGATIGASTTKLVGKAKNLEAPGDIAGSYSTLGASGAVAGGVGAVRLQNKKGVILELGGPQVGLELSAAVGGIRITME